MGSAASLLRLNNMIGISAREKLTSKKKIIRVPQVGSDTGTGSQSMPWSARARRVKRRLAVNPSIPEMNSVRLWEVCAVLCELSSSAVVGCIAFFGLVFLGSYIPFDFHYGRGDGPTHQSPRSSRDEHGHHD